MPPKVEKPGYKTTEFWMALAAMIVTYLTSTELGDESTWVGKIIAIAAAVFISLGYGTQRMSVKKEAIRNGKV